jgi:hypothetical protein
MHHASHVVMVKQYKLTVEIEAPSPVQLLCKDAAKYGAECRRDCPNGANNPQVQRTVTAIYQYILFAP